MREWLRGFAAGAFIVGVGGVVYGLRGGMPCVPIAPVGRLAPRCLPLIDDQTIIAVGAMLIAAGILGMLVRER